MHIPKGTTLNLKDVEWVRVNRRGSDACKKIPY